MPLVIQYISSIAFLLITFTAPQAARAGDGHDHGAPAQKSTTPSLPRMTAVSEIFEVVGVLNGKQITLYLDRFKDNAPVNDAELEVEIAGTKQKAEKHAEGEYELVLKDMPKPGALSLTISVKAGAEADLLAGEFDIHAPEPATQSSASSSTRQKALWALSLGVALLLVGFLVRRTFKKINARRRSLV